MEVTIGAGQVVELTWCTNIFPCATPGELLDLLRGPAGEVRRRLASDRSMGLGLWLPATLVEALLADPEQLAGLQETLAGEQLHLVTANCFPQGVFHGTPVKDLVYQPDWSRPERLDYTCRAMELAASLVPAGTTLPISTLPWGLAGLGEELFSAGARLLARATVAAERILAERGVEIILCPEPEPGCLFERGDRLLPRLAQVPSFLAGDPAAAARWRRHLGLCLDTCHCAVMGEDPIATLAEAARLGVRVGKLQLASALTLTAPGADSPALLAPFRDGLYRHQTAFFGAAGERVADFMDLEPALESLESLAVGAKPERMVVHFHLPLHWEGRGAMRGTGPTMLEPFLSRVDLLPPVLEVETYTWAVLPADLVRQGPAAGVAAELDWVIRCLE